MPVLVCVGVRVGVSVITPTDTQVRINSQTGTER